MQLSSRTRKIIRCSINAITLATLIFINTHIFYIHYKIIQDGESKELEILRSNKVFKDMAMKIGANPETVNLKRLGFFRLSTAIQTILIIGSSVLICFNKRILSASFSLSVPFSLICYILFFYENLFFFRQTGWKSYYLRNFLFAAIITYFPLIFLLFLWYMNNKKSAKNSKI